MCNITRSHSRAVLVVCLGMLDLIITSYKITINVSSYLQEYIQYPVDYTYNTIIQKCEKLPNQRNSYNVTSAVEKSTSRVFLTIFNTNKSKINLHKHSL